MRAPKTDNGVFIISTSDRVCLDFEARHVKGRPSECWAMLVQCAAFPQGEKYEMNIGFPLLGRVAGEGSHEFLTRIGLYLHAIHHRNFELLEIITVN